jgi:DNA-binding PadR family transcriptional regulator
MINKQSMYGYQIIKELEGRSQGYFKFKEGTLYPALHRLENSGLIEGKWQVLGNGQQRKYYYLTAKGLESLAEKKSHWNEFFVAMNLIIHAE